jgi:hypothetical protein
MENNNAIIMPEVILYKSLKSIFEIVKKDYNDNVDKEKTLLYSLFGKDENGDLLNFEEFEYFKQSIETFVLKTPQVNLGYNLEVANLGCVHILLPAENGSPLSIGGDEGYVPNQVDEAQGIFREVFAQKFDTTYNLLISSENTFEVVLIYNLLKASFLALNAHFELAGLRLPKVSGQDLNVDSNLVPTHIFHRSLMVNFFYELIVPNFFYRSLVKEFTISGIANNGD